MLTKEVLDEIIRRRSSEGLTLSIEKIEGEAYSSGYIKDRAKKYYGNWTNALIANDAKPNERYNVSKDEVILELKRLQNEGHSMKIGEFESWLKYAINRFGGYKKIKTEIGLASSYRYNKTDARKRADEAKRKYSDEDLSNLLREAVSKCDVLNDIWVNHQKIVSAIKRRFESLSEFAAKYEIDLPPNSEVWSDDKIRETLTRLQGSGIDISASYVRNNGYAGLHGAVVRKYGTWNKGIVSLGFQVAYPSPQMDWSRERVRHETLAAIKNGTTPSMTAIDRVVTGYAGAVNKYFDGFSEVKDFCGICLLTERPKTITNDYRARLTSQEGVRREIIRLYYIGSPLNYCAIAKYRKHLLEVSRTYFGGWKEALEYCGFDYSKIALEDNIKAECGHDFEKVLGEILTELGVEYKKYCHERYNPDFVLSDGVWVDAKLSEWTDVYDMLRKYLPLCESVTVVYLIGRKTESLRGSKYPYKSTSAYLLTDKLPNGRRDYFNAKLKDIESKLNANELGSHSQSETA